MQSSLERLRARREELDGEGGFTLIELLIVIVILAILAAIVVFAVQNLTGSSAKAACESDVQTTDHAIQAYVAQMGKQPTEIQNADGTKTDQLMPTVQLTGSNNDPVGPWLHNVPTNGTHYSVEIATINKTAYPVVITPGAAAPIYNANAGSDLQVVYEANGQAAAGHPSSDTTDGPADATATTESGACVNVTS